MGWTTHTCHPKILKIDIYKYRRVKAESLLLWVVELDRAIRAHRIDYKEMKLTFAQTHLAGHAKARALGLKMSDPYAFRSLVA